MGHLITNTKALILRAGIAIHLTSAATAEVVTLENTSGSKLTVKLVSCDGTNLTVVRLSDDKSFFIPLSKLTEGSKDAVKAWQDKGGGLIENFSINVVTGKNRRTTARDDFDDKRVNLDPVVTVSNPDTKIASREAKVTVLFLGRPVADNSAIHVFKKSTFDLPSLQAGEKRDFKIGKITSAYDNRGYAKFGSRYLGYVVLVHDPEGGTLFTSKAVPTTLVSASALNYLNLETKKIYDKNLKPVRLPTYTDN